MHSLLYKKVFAVALGCASSFSALGQSGGNYPHQSILPATQQDVQALQYTNGSLTSYGHGAEGESFASTLKPLTSSVKCFYQSASDWSGYDGVMITVANTGSSRLELLFRLDTQRPHGPSAGSVNSMLLMEAGASRNIIFWFDQGPAQYGFRTAIANFPNPYQFSARTNFSANLRTVYQWGFYNRSSCTSSFTIAQMQLVTKRADLSGAVDVFGQWTLDNWSGAVHSKADLLNQAATESAQLASEPVLGALQGTTQVPKMDATGKWHFGKSSNGNWFFVHPNGNPFWSLGLNAVYSEDATTLDNRAGLFQSLPTDNPQWGSIFRLLQANDGSWVNTVDFHQANLQTKYGATWRTDFQNLSLNRLPKWGFNTLGAWSDPAMCRGQVPFTVLLQTQGFTTRLAVPFCPWGSLPDPYDAAFVPWMLTAFGPRLQAFNGQPNFIGVCVDNEPSWCFRGTSSQYFQVPIAVLNASPTQPAKIAFMSTLAAKYGSIAGLNTAWGTSFASWDALDLTNGFGNQSINAAMQSDFSQYISAYATTYYSSVRSAIDQLGISGLYLGSRDAYEWTPDEVFSAAAPYVDAYTVNVYSNWDKTVPILQTLTRPVVIGEFCFSAIDRGQCCFGMPIEVSAQTDRARMIDKFLKTALSVPNIVGAHFFSYLDQPSSGRYFDNSRWNSGMVDVCDIPYQPVVTEFQSISKQIYTIHN